MRKLLLMTSCWALAVSTFGVADEGESRQARPDLPAKAAAVAEETHRNESSPAWYDRITVGGDFRLRYEGFSWSGNFDGGRRDRFRYRLRFGLRANVLDHLTVGVQLRSGNPKNPISDNQSLDDGFSKKTIAISEAYADWQAAESLQIVVGKFVPEGLWSVSDMHWDDDVVAEGAMERFTVEPGGFVKELNVNLYQLVLNESGGGAESYLLGGQVAPTLALGKSDTLVLGLGYESITQPQEVAELYFDGDLVIDSGHVTNFVDPLTGDLVSDFRVGNAFVEWKNKSIEGWPIKATLHFYKNFGAGDGEGAILTAPDADETLVVGRGSDNDTAWFGRIQIGDYKKPGQVAVRLSRYDSKPDAVFFAYGQSDTRRASNVDGYRTDLRVGGPKSSYVNVTWYRTDWTLGESSAMDRWQLDYIIRF